MIESEQLGRKLFLGLTGDHSRLLGVYLRIVNMISYTNYFIVFEEEY